MFGTHRSPYRRLRALSSLGLGLALMAALVLLAGGHVAHAVLMALAGMSLLPTSHLGRRARRRVVDDSPWHAVSPSSATSKPRRAA